MRQTARSQGQGLGVPSLMQERICWRTAKEKIEPKISPIAEDSDHEEM